MAAMPGKLKCSYLGTFWHSEVQWEQNLLRSDRKTEALKLSPCITPGGKWLIVPWMRRLSAQ